MLTIFVTSVALPATSPITQVPIPIPPYFPLLLREPVSQFHAALYVGILANVNVGSNFWIYIARSQEYQKAFAALFFSHASQTAQSSGWFASLSLSD